MSIVSMIELLRNKISRPKFDMLVLPLVTTLLLLVGGLVYFQKYEQTFADVI